MSSRSRGAVAQPREGDAAGRGSAGRKRPNPWRDYAGIWRENPDFGVLLREIEAVRRETAEAEKKPV